MEYERNAGGVLVPAATVNGLKVGGAFSGQHIRDGVVIDEWDDHNLIVDEGLMHVLDVLLHGGTQIGTWYLALFEGNYTPVSTLTAATFTAAATESTAYDESTRQAYVEAAPAANSITNSANKATFTMNATKTIYGAALMSASAKSATTGTLLAAARFAASKSVVDNDQLLLTYTFNASSV